MEKTLYFEIEDDLKRIIDRLRKDPGKNFTLVLPQKSYLFADPINLKLLKKQLDLAKKTASILTLDERGQSFAKQAGFTLKAQVRGMKGAGLMGDILLTPKGDAKQEDNINNMSENFVEKTLAEKRPKKTTKAKITALKVERHDAVFTPEAKSALVSSTAMFEKPPRLKKQPRKHGWVISLVILVLIAGSMVLVLPSAEVTVEAKSEQVKKTISLTLLPDQTSGSTKDLLLPAQRSTRQLEISDKFETQGKEEVGSKARGVIKIVNLSGGTLNLRSSTTTLSSENGQQYRFVADQTQIRALEQADLAKNPDAGHSAEVEAVTAGEAANLKVGQRVEITNQVFGKRPDVLYGRVVEELTGGNSRFVSVITEADFTQAKEKLVLSAVDQVRTALELDGLVVPEKGWTSSVVEFFAEKPVGTQTASFIARAKIDLSLVAFKDADLRDVLRSRIEKQTASNLVLQPKELDMVEYTMATEILTDTRLDVKADYTTKTSSQVDTAKLTSDLKGADKAKAEEIIQSNENIGKAEIKISPAWLPRLPFWAKRIHIKVAGW